jgi:hypothetical protein
MATSVEEVVAREEIRVLSVTSMRGPRVDT